MRIAGALPRRPIRLVTWVRHSTTDSVPTDARARRGGPIVMALTYRTFVQHPICGRSTLGKGVVPASANSHTRVLNRWNAARLRWRARWATMNLTRSLTRDGAGNVHGSCQAVVSAAGPNDRTGKAI